MKKVIILIGIYPIMSCAVFKHKSASSSAQKVLTVHASHITDSLQMRLQTQHIQFLSLNQQDITEIIPQGTFSYRPDSGFIGQASHVTVYRQQKQQSQIKDATGLQLSTTHHQQKIDSTLQQQSRQNREETQKSKPTLIIWIYVMAGILLIIGYAYLKKFRKCGS
ncbi:hypothetical protein SAMN05216436_10717 [bacterium A37T11]|nr:hypothetical protein SAMN05216436_10717 [bacterium A37T11]